MTVAMSECRDVAMSEPWTTLEHMFEGSVPECSGHQRARTPAHALVGRRARSAAGPDLSPAGSAAGHSTTGHGPESAAAPVSGSAPRSTTPPTVEPSAAPPSPPPQPSAHRSRQSADRPAEPTSSLEPHVVELLARWWRETRPAWVAVEWYDAALRQEVRALMQLPPGAELVAALGALDVADRCTVAHRGEELPGDPVPGSAPGWPCPCQLVIAAAWEACTGWLAAQAARSLVAIAGPEPVELRTPTRQTIVDPAREEVALALRLSPPSAHNRITSARELLGQPALVELVETGACSAWVARCVLSEVAALDPEEADAVVATIAGRIRQRHLRGQRAWTAAEVRRTTQSIRLSLFPGSTARMRAAARSGRRVEVLPEADGMSVLRAFIDSTQAHRIHRRLTAIARGLEDPDLTCDQVRADVLVDVLLGAGLPVALSSGVGGGLVPESEGTDANSEPAGDAPTPQASCGAGADRDLAGPLLRPAPAPEICVVVSLETLLGLAEGAAEIPDLGPIPAEVARELAADGRWRAWVTDASGQVVSTGSRTYTPTAAAARLVRAREPHCRMPGCRRPAINCDLDHTIPWPRGSTTPQNLGPLCRRHHQLKTHAGWSLLPDPDGWRWRTPSGLTIREGPEPPLHVEPRRPEPPPAPGQESPT